MERVYFDGDCGLCHRGVRFILARDRTGHFRFAPLQGETFRERIPESKRKELPDSMIVETEDGRLLERSDAVVHILRNLRGLWKALGWILAPLPRFLRDPLYTAVASTRHRLFASPSSECPVPPESARDRFDP